MWNYNDYEIFLSNNKRPDERFDSEISILFYYYALLNTMKNKRFKKSQINRVAAKREFNQELLGERMLAISDLRAFQKLQHDYYGLKINIHQGDRFHIRDQKEWIERDIRNTTEKFAKRFDLLGLTYDNF
jgi:hypothetical protein